MLCVAETPVALISGQATDLFDLGDYVESLFSRSLMTRRASVIGMLVYRDSTSQDTMISSGPMVCCQMNCEKSLQFLQCCWLSLVYGLSMSAMYLDSW